MVDALRFIHPTQLSIPFLKIGMGELESENL
jgi:hypothetical protein